LPSKAGERAQAVAALAQQTRAVVLLRHPTALRPWPGHWRCWEIVV